MNGVLYSNQTEEANSVASLTSYRRQSNRQTNQDPPIERNADNQHNRAQYSQSIEMEENSAPPPSYNVLFGNNPETMPDQNEASSDNNDLNNLNSHHSIDNRSQNISSSTDSTQESDAALPSYSDLFDTN